MVSRCACALFMEWRVYMPEKQNVEWKEKWKDEYLKWICDFANTQGGTIYIGKNDNGDIVGIENAKNCLKICRIK